MIDFERRMRRKGYLLTLLLQSFIYLREKSVAKKEGDI